MNRKGDDRGETLVELLVTITIMGLAGVAIMAGLQMSVLGAALGRNQANSDAYVRSAAEAIQNSAASTGGYKSCSAAPAAYQTVGQAAVNASSGQTGVYTLTVSNLQAWNSASGWGSCSGTPSAESMTLIVTSPGSGGHQAIEQLTMTVRQPCTGAVPTATNQTATPCS